MHLSLLCLLIYNIILWFYFPYKHFVICPIFCIFIKNFLKYAFISFTDLETIDLVDYNSFYFFSFSGHS